MSKITATMHEPEIERAKILNHVFTTVRAHHISEQKCVELVMECYATRCDPPVTLDEATRVARRIYRGRASPSRGGSS